ITCSPPGGAMSLTRLFFFHINVWLSPVSQTLLPPLPQCWWASADLQQELYHHLAAYVPRIFLGRGEGNSREEQKEELACQLLLLAPLEWLLLGEDPASGLALLQENNCPSALCGHVFKVGEPTYSCRECAADPTCVLCMQCFLESAHRQHRYRMTTSGGGGFCDCGDTEAWKNAPWCQKHARVDGHTEEVRKVFFIILKYAVDLLTWEQEDQLPAGLEPPYRADTYFCVVFNDEVHTYEQVIYTLQKAVSCSHKEALSFATAVDREGRKSVRFGDFQFCEQAKSVIVVNSASLIQRNKSRQSKPLRVQVMHSSVVAHQCFALKTLKWLGQIIKYSDGLRRILCQVGLQQGPEGENSSLVDRLMLNDSRMWKGARNIYHQLLMNSVLMDLKFKKIFAIQFAKNYRSLQTDFLEDDHERVVSVTSLSVQLFTVPTVGRMLMVEENLMTTIIRTFVDHLRHRDVHGRFQFDRYTAQQAFKFGRVQSLIGDLKYVLISAPSEWSDSLRVKFLEGFDAVLDLLTCMQGMDPVVRQVGQHIEMEPEWEAAFTLQMKLTHIISMIQDWCSTDERVLIQAYRKCLSALTQCHGGLLDGEPPVSLSMAGHCVETFRYQVSQDKVSIHLPVCRLLAGLHVLLSRTEVASRFPEQLPLVGVLPLRCLVLCAQVHAGMWRRNGFSLINQIYYYHNVKCRMEMFDKDIIMLQAGASMMDPNHFLMMVLSRFELFHIFSSDFVQQNTLIEEMLHLIIMVIGERYVAGVGQVEPLEEVRREIIHQLSIRPMAHSELVKALPENGNKETGLERVIDSVALFKSPGVTGRGLYELRPESFKHFNLYFHHYSRADHSFAVSDLSRDPAVALPPPLPPPLCPLFGSLVNLLQCDVLLAVESAVLQWAMEPGGGGWTESMLQRVSQQGKAPTSSGSILALLETLQNAPHLEVHKDMITWILKVKRTSSASKKEKAERKRKAEMARLRREKIMAQMSEMQKNFINENKEMFQQSGEEMGVFPSLELTCASQVCVGPRRVGGSERRQQVICILCQEEQEVTGVGQAMVLAAFVQRSTVLSRNRHWRDPPRDRLTPTLSVATSCTPAAGRARSLCSSRYFEAVQLKEQRRQQRLRGHNSYDVENGEFLCPLCECLSNTVIPLLPHTPLPDHSADHLSLEAWLKKTSQQVESSPFSISICEMIITFSMSVYKVGLKTNPNEQDHRVPVLSWSTCAYTIQSIGENSPERASQDDCLSALTRFSSACWASVPLRTVHAHLSRLLTVLLPDPPVENAPCILHVDMFHLLVYAVLSYNSLHSTEPSGPSVDSSHVHLLHLITVAHMVQILLTSVTALKCNNLMINLECKSSSSHSTKSVVLPDVSSGWQLLHRLKVGLLPFLRAAALFFHYLNSSVPPTDLMGECSSAGWEVLCSYLSLPSNLLLLYQSETRCLCRYRWCHHPALKHTLQGGGDFIRFPRESNRLIDLPEDYSVLINQASSFTCPRSGGDKSRAPTLCLVCGAMLCSQSYCCQVEFFPSMNCHLTVVEGFEGSSSPSPVWGIPWQTDPSRLY
uniref:E3 ubiquitin-protein ligase n=1 Tax=Oryzias melastigma TaxID=30732 RepID=A0A3B3CHS1_ORYME